MKYTENKAQIEIVNYLRSVLPHSIVAHIKNQGSRGGAVGAKEGARLKKMGVVAGMPDIVVINWANIGCFWVEVKAKGGSTSPAQKALHAKLEVLGYKICTAKSHEDVKDFMIANHIGFSEKIT